MIDGAGAHSRWRWSWPIVLAALLLFVTSAAYFATRQNVWIDESTQLLGSRLPFGRMLAWLAGAPEQLGVPPDRTPPLSYVADWLGLRLVSPDPLGLRLFHLGVAAIGVGLLTWLAGRHYGTIAALATAALLALSPQLTDAAVEIRPYPWFFTITAVQLVLLYRLFDARRIDAATLVPLTLAGIVALYTHFFGLVSSSALFVGVVVGLVRSRRALLAVLVAWAVLLVAAIGLAPFIGGARAASGEAAPQAHGVAALAGYLAHLLGHAAMLLSPPLAILFYLGVGGLVAIAALRIIAVLPRWDRHAPLPPEVALAAVIAAGIGATVAAAFVSHGFDPLKPSYSLWLLAPIALLAGSACAAREPWRRIAAVLAIVVTVALAAIQSGHLRHADWFVHGPERAIADAVGADPRGTAVIYAGPGWAYGYYPLVYRYGGALDQYLAAGSGAIRPIGLGGDDRLPATSRSALDRYRRLLIVSITLRSGSDLRRLRSGALVPPPAANIDAVPGGWRQDGALTVPGLYWLDMHRFERTAPR